MDAKRILRHLMASERQVRRAFPRATLLAIEQAIQAGEAVHGGQIRFAVEGTLDGVSIFKGQSARARAIEVFSQLRVWDTEHNNGVLIYVLLADRDVEVVADRGIHAKVGSHEWETICRDMETAFGRGQYAEGAIAGVQAVAALLEQHFPRGLGWSNELPDRPVII